MLSGRMRGKHSSHPARWDLREPPRQGEGELRLSPSPASSTRRAARVHNSPESQN